MKCRFSYGVQLPLVDPQQGGEKRQLRRIGQCERVKCELRPSHVSFGTYRTLDTGGTEVVPDKQHMGLPRCQHGMYPGCGLAGKRDYNSLGRVTTLQGTQRVP